MTTANTALSPQALEWLRLGAEETGVTLTPEALEGFSRLYGLLLAGNARLNLTALKTERDIVLKHFVDSLTCLRGGHLDGDLRVLDLGTGAGFPSLPLALVRPELQLTPLDATRKKITYVTETAAALGLTRVTPLAGRAEALGRDPAHRGTYDRVVARAVAALPILVELALPLLRVGGRLVAQKGPIEDDELRAGDRAAELLGGTLVAVEEFTLPLGGDARTLVVVEKRRPTPDAYPRREGVPNQQPLFWASR